MVVDEAGQPVPGARMIEGQRGMSAEQASAARAKGFHGLRPEQEVPLDATGAFTVLAPSGERLQMTAWAEGRAPVSRPLFARPGLGAVERFVLAPAAPAPIKGVVVDDLGTPVVGAWVFAGAERTKTDQSGAFVINALSLADPTIMVSAPGRSVTHRVVDPTALVRIEFAAAGRIAGKVLNRDGAPVAGTMIFLEPLQDPDEKPVGAKRRKNDEAYNIQRSPTTTSAADGTFSIPVQLDLYEIWGAGTESVAAHRGDMNVTLKLP